MLMESCTCVAAKLLLSSTGCSNADLSGMVMYAVLFSLFAFALPEPAHALTSMAQVIPVAKVEIVFLIGCIIKLKLGEHTRRVQIQN